MDAARGKYQRGSSRAQRAERERRALSDAAHAALAELPEHEITVAHLCTRARVGRNTLYLHWPSVAGLIGELVQRAEAQLRAALVLDAEQVRTPRSRLAALSLRWLEFLSATPQAGGVLFRSNPGRAALDRVLGYELLQLGRQAYASGLSSRVPGEEVLIALSGAFRAVGERAVRGRLSLEFGELAGILTQIALGALR